MRRLLLLALLAAALPAAAQPFTFDEAVRGGGPSSDTAEGVALGSDGSRAVAGTFEGTATFGDVSVTSTGDSDFFLVKYAPDGEAVWARRGGTDVFNDFGTAAAIAPDGSVYATGFFTGVATFDGGASPDASLTTFSDFDVFLVKYDGAGDLLWVRQAGGTEQDTGRDLALDADGNVYLVGGFAGTGTFGGVTLTSAGSSDAFLAKYAPDGTVLWAQRGGSDQGDLGYGVAATPEGAAHISGSFRGVAQFGGLAVQSAGSSDVFVVQYDPDGAPVWAQSLGADGAEFTRGGGIGLGANGDVYVQGSFSNTILVGGDVLVSTGFTDVFVAKLDADGEEVWGRRGGGGGTNFSAALAVDAGGNALAVGYADGTGTFAGTPITTQGRDGYFAVFDAEGDLVTVELLGGTGQDAATGIAVSDVLGRFAAAGFFRDTAMFGDTTLTSAGSNDVFLLSGESATVVLPSLLFVDADATGANDGSSWTDAFTDLQDALALAGQLDLDSLAIWVAEGTYLPTGDGDRTVSFELLGGLALYGGFDGTETALDQRDPGANETVLSGDLGVSDDNSDNSYHVVAASGVEGAFVDGLIIERGYAEGSFDNPDENSNKGGGLLLIDSSVSMNRVTVSRNQAGAFEDRAGFGAGFYASGGQLELEDVVVTLNGISSFLNGSGGGGYATDGASLLLRRTVFRSNSTAGPEGGSGGGLTVSGSSLFAVDSRFENNTQFGTNGIGGGLWCSGSLCTVIGSVFLENQANNSAAQGGGLGVSSSSTASLINVQFFGNTAYRGGAISSFGDLTLINTVLIGNEARWRSDDLSSGGALWCGGSSLTSITNSAFVSNMTPSGDGGEAIQTFDKAVVEGTNSIIWQTAPNPIGNAESGTTLIEHTIVEGGYPGSAILDADPLFAQDPDPGPDGAWGTEDDDYGDLRLQEGSPAIDFGLAEFLPPDIFDLDQDGDTEEPLPVDLDGNARVQGNAPDLGAYESPFTVALEPGAGTPAQNALGAAYPNPFAAHTTLALDLASAQTVTVEVFDLLGRRVATVHDGPLAVGTHRVVIEAGWPAGVYVVRASGETFQQAQRVTVVR